MCLGKVTRKNVKLKKDKVVYGCVQIINGVQKSWLKDIPLQIGKNAATCFGRAYTEFEKHLGYRCGFHRFIKGSDAVAWVLLIRDRAGIDLYVKKHIIPAGTVVTYGRQEEMNCPGKFDHEKAVVIVSPIIINPQGERK